MSINIIAAVNEDFAIGDSKTNDLLYKIKGDLKRFKELTLNSYAVMGRNTFESLTSPLKDRCNVVLSTNKNYVNKIDKSLLDEYDIIIENDFEKILNYYKFSGNQDKDLNIIGGSYLFSEGIHWADNIFLTMIHDKDNPNADIFFPKQELSEFKEVGREKNFDEASGLYYSFINYKRKDIKDLS